jgi:hypothetical protein
LKTAGVSLEQCTGILTAKKKHGKKFTENNIYLMGENEK